jgi:hypothetical protein
MNATKSVSSLSLITSNDISTGKVDPTFPTPSTLTRPLPITRAAPF